MAGEQLHRVGARLAQDGGQHVPDVGLVLARALDVDDRGLQNATKGQRLLGRPSRPRRLLLQRLLELAKAVHSRRHGDEQPSVPQEALLNLLRRARAVPLADMDAPPCLPTTVCGMPSRRSSPSIRRRSLATDAANPARSVVGGAAAATRSVMTS